MTNKNKKPNKITYDLNEMLDGYDGLTQTDYKWKIIDDPKGKHKYCYEVRIFRHVLNPPSLDPSSLGHKPVKEIKKHYGKAIN